MSGVRRIVRALLWTQGWGALVLGLILTAAQAPLNRSLIGVYLFVSTVFLLLAKLLPDVAVVCPFDATRRHRCSR